MTSLGVPTSGASNPSAGQKRTRDEGSVSEGGAMKGSKANDSQAVIADASLNAKEHQKGASNV